MDSFDSYLATAESAIAELSLPVQPQGLYEPISYTLSGGGKRMRPVLCLAACDAFGSDYVSAVNQAVAVEVFHNFTLLHDDVMDKAEMRRGRPTVHVRWDSRHAILSGDAMLTLSNMLVMKDVAASVAVAASALLSKTAMEVYEGQQLDMDFEHRSDVSVDEYIEMIRLKTSVLIGCACKMGALVAGASDDDADKIYSYGEMLGLAFQLRDDYLDTFGDPIVFGKEIGGDILNDKKTWLSINAAIEDRTGVMRRAYNQELPEDEKIDAVRRVYLDLGLDRRCDQLIDRYIDEAIDCLKGINMTPGAKQFFIDFAEKSRNRTH